MTYDHWKTTPPDEEPTVHCLDGDCPTCEGWGKVEGVQTAKPLRLRPRGE